MITSETQLELTKRKKKWKRSEKILLNILALCVVFVGVWLRRRLEPGIVTNDMPDQDREQIANRMTIDVQAGNAGHFESQLSEDVSGPESLEGAQSRDLKGLSEDSNSLLRNAIREHEVSPEPFQSESLHPFSDSAGPSPLGFQQTAESQDAFRSRELSDIRNDEASRLCAIRAYPEATRIYEEAILCDRTNPRPKMNLARLLATCPDASVRDGARAVELANSGCNESAEPNWQYFAILAAAYAECGNFAEAIDWGTKAKTLAAGADAGAMDVNLRLFQSGKSCCWETDL